MKPRKLTREHVRAIALIGHGAPLQVRPRIFRNLVRAGIVAGYRLRSTQMHGAGPFVAGECAVLGKGTNMLADAVQLGLEHVRHGHADRRRLRRGIFPPPPKVPDELQATPAPADPFA